MRISRGARRYAAALDAVACADGCDAAVVAALEAVVQLASASPDLARLLGDPSIHRQARARIVAALFDGRVPPLAARFLTMLAERRRLALLPEICAVLCAAARKRTGTVAVAVTLARVPDNATTGTLTARLQALTGHAVALSTQVDRRLLGGFTARVGDTLYDVSLAGALRAFRRAVVAGDAAVGAL
jgi:F-type H+-transporting ATPase subunit delta